MATRKPRREGRWTRLKHSRFAAGIVALVAVSGTAVTVTGNIDSFFENIAKLSVRFVSSASTPKVEFVQVRLAQEAKEWREVARNEPNYRYTRDQGMLADNPAELARLEEEKRRGRYSCPGEFYRDDWCGRAERLFSQKVWRETAVDPVFDVVVRNAGDRALVFRAIGVEILGAENTVISGGDVQTGVIGTSATYEVDMPDPVTVRSGDVEVRVSGESRLVGGSLEYEWTGLPLAAVADIADPVRIAAADVYRFNVVLRRYAKMPNNVLLRFVLGIEKTLSKSDPYYLLAM